MILTDSLRRLSNAKMTFRRDLKCYVDSWPGPLTGGKGCERDNPCVYAFLTPETEKVKIGSTSLPIRRLYQIRYTVSSPYSPADSSMGSYVLVEPCPLLKLRDAERVTHAILSPWRVPSLGRRKHNGNEWYDVDRLIAERAVMLAVAFAEGAAMFPSVDYARNMINKM